MSTPLVVGSNGDLQMLRPTSADVPAQVVLAEFLERLGVKAPRSHLSIDNVIPTIAILLGAICILIVLVWDRL
jgi:hypothetical protein